MSSVPQVSPGVDLDRRLVKTGINYRRTLPASLPASKLRILMVGQNTSWGAPLQSALKELGCDFSFAPSLPATITIARSGSYALLLLDSTVPVAIRKELVSRLAGSGTTVFQLFPVENGCWWLPVMRQGEDSFGSPGFRTKELRVELGRLLQDRSQI